MEGEPKKISFGFSKLLKKSTVKPPEEKKQFIDCLEGKSIKVIGGDITEEKKPLIIPLKEKDRTTTSSALARIARGEVDIVPAENGTPDVTEAEPVPGESLDKMAEREILEDLKKETKKQANNANLVVPVADNIKLTGEKESTLEDYENIPVSDFGMAMLRGMGWQPGKGMGKHGKSSELVLPNLRPKGMGLGADKVSSIMLKNETINSKGVDEDLKIVKGAYVKIVAGKQSGTYGQISGFDEDSGRLIIKTAIGGTNINVNEFMAQAITKDEYQKMSKVINAAKYEEYKMKETRNSNDQDKRKEEKQSDSRNKTSYEKDKRESKSTSRSQEISDRDNNDHGERKHKDGRTSTSHSTKYSVEQPSSDRLSKQSEKEKDNRREYVKLNSRSTSSSPEPEPRRDIDKKRKGKKKRRDRSRSRERRRH